ADLFLADLLGVAPGRRARGLGEDGGEAGDEGDFGPSGGGGGREAVFRRRPGEAGGGVAPAGAPLRGVGPRPDGPGGRGSRGLDGRGWRATLVETLIVKSLHGPDGLLHENIIVLRRAPLPRPARARGARNGAGEADGAAELIEVCGFFGPNNVRRTEQEIRNA